MRNLARLARGGPFELVIGAAIVLLAAVLLFAHSYISETFDSSRKWSSASDELKVRITESHLWLEERLGGDTTVDVAGQVFDNIDGAQTMCRALVDGGRTDVGKIERLPGGEARATAAMTCAEIVSLRNAAKSRLRSGGNDVGTPADTSYDASFNRIIRLSRATERVAERHVEDRRELTERVNTGTVAFLSCSSWESSFSFAVTRPASGDSLNAATRSSTPPATASMGLIVRAGRRS